MLRLSLVLMTQQIPAARGDEGPLAGMPIIDADAARTVVIVKRSLSVGYAGVDNDFVLHG